MNQGYQRQSMIKSIKHYVLILVILTFSSCEKKEASFVLNGNIKGLKKGTVYLQKFKDTLLVVVDSIQLHGEGIFTLKDEVENPEIYFLTLDKIQTEKIFLTASNENKV